MVLKFLKMLIFIPIDFLFSLVETDNSEASNECYILFKQWLPFILEV